MKERRCVREEKIFFYFQDKIWVEEEWKKNGKWKGKMGKRIRRKEEQSEEVPREQKRREEFWGIPRPSFTVR